MNGRIGNFKRFLIKVDDVEVVVKWVQSKGLIGSIIDSQRIEIGGQRNISQRRQVGAAGHTNKGRTGGIAGGGLGRYRFAVAVVKSFAILRQGHSPRAKLGTHLIGQVGQFAVGGQAVQCFEAIKRGHDQHLICIGQR